MKTSPAQITLYETACKALVPMDVSNLKDSAPRPPPWRRTVAALDEAGALLEVIDMPVAPEANSRTTTNAPILAAILAKTHAHIAFLEFVAAPPTDAKTAAFAFGRAETALIGLAELQREGRR